MQTTQNADFDTCPFLDLSDPGFSVRSAAVRDARAAGWMARTPYGLAVLRYDAMKEMIMHPALRQGSYRWPDHHGASGSWAQWWKRIMLNREGEAHLRLRRLGSLAFAPKLVGALMPGFRALADELIAGFLPRRHCEFMADFADPYATRVICSVIGIPQDEWRELADTAVEMGLALGVGYARDQARIDAATERMFAFARRAVAERRKNPKDDFINALITASIEQSRLNEQELYDMIVLSIFGGIDTTRGQLGLAMQMFLEHPRQWDLLARNPELARQAVEEVMRHRPTTTWVTREATQDFVFRGYAIAKGTTIHLLSESAGTDPAQFPQSFDITQKRKPHFGFGGGKHHCLGSPIARADMAVALCQLSQSLRNLRAGGDARNLPDSGNTGPSCLPLCFEPGP